MRGRLSYDPTGIRALIRGRRNERGGGSSPSWNAFVLPRCTHSTVEPVQREPWLRRKRREPGRQREAWIGFSHAISPTRSSQERVDRFRSPIWPSSRGIIMFRTDIAMPWAMASSCIERNGSPVSTPPVWCFRQTPVATRSVVNLRTVRRLNRNANLYASPDLRAAHLFLADDCECLEIADIFVEARVIWILRHFGKMKGNFWIIWRVIWFKTHIL